MDWSQIYGVVDVLSTVSAVPVAIVGFWIAFAQIRKTLVAAEAARDTAIAARSDARRASVLVLLPQLQRIEEQLDRAVDANSVDLVVAWANTWRWQASQLNEHLRGSPSPNPQLSQLLQTSVTAATSTKQSLVSSTPTDLRRTTKRLRDSVADVTSELGGLTVIYASLPEGNGP